MRCGVVCGMLYVVCRMLYAVCGMRCGACISEQPRWYVVYHAIIVVVARDLMNCYSSFRHATSASLSSSSSSSLPPPPPPSAAAAASSSCCLRACCCYVYHDHYRHHYSYHYDHAYDRKVHTLIIIILPADAGAGNAAVAAAFVDSWLFVCLIVRLFFCLFV